MALMPKRVKHRKSQRGRIRGNATRGNRVVFGDYGLQAVQGGWVRNNPNGERTAEDLGGEIGDALMMLYKFAEKSGRMPFTALKNKMRTKGFEP